MCNFYGKPTKCLFFALVATTFCVSVGFAQEKSRVERALSYKPVQRLVDYDSPKKEDVKSCKIEDSLKKFGKAGFVVYDKSGRILRLFLDVNRNGDLDSFAYFKDGIEVYRDIDTDFNGKACLLYTSPSPRDATLSRMPSSA